MSGEVTKKQAWAFLIVANKEQNTETKTMKKKRKLTSETLKLIQMFTIVLPKGFQTNKRTLV